MEDKNLRRQVRRVLLSGMAASGLLMVLGLAARSSGGNETSLIRAGILVLITTPVAQVLVIALRCAAGGDRKFLGVSLGILALLGTGMWLGF